MSKKADLKRAQEAIVNALAQHASFNYRASTAVVNKLKGEIDTLSKRVALDLLDRLEGLSAAELQAFSAGKYTTPKLKAMKAEIDGWGVALNQVITSEWAKSALALAAYESTYTKDLLNQVFAKAKNVSLKPERLYRNAMNRPVMGKLVADMLKDASSTQVDRMYATIRQGIVSGQTTVEIVRALRGTEALDYTDGLFEAAKADVEKLVRTARNHIADVASEDTYRALDVETVVRVASLEGRTCKVCAALDGREYAIDEPRPPATLHYNCRCGYAPKIDGELIGNRPFMRAEKVRGGYKIEDGERVPLPAQYRSLGRMTPNQREQAGLVVGQVSASTNYSKWFADQDATFQREWLGKTRYELYKTGGYKLDRFVDPKKGTQYSIDELRMKDRQTFKEIFGG